MNLEAQLTALKTENRNLPLTERATLSCRLAKQLEKAGKYELAFEALAEFWPEREGSPNLEGLDVLQQAEVLLRIGAIAGWLGSTDQTAGGPGGEREERWCSTAWPPPLRQPLPSFGGRGTSPREGRENYRP